MKFWADLVTGKEYFTQEEVYNEIFNTIPDMEAMGAALEEFYEDEIIKELERLKSPLYYKILKRARDLRLKDEIIEIEETEDIEEDE